ncbi:hypothetical protein [Saccharibacillus kuerlensis]|uniref:GAF domain-containing protein n=1 Tax=Saccharibacillus kuerlensis TaxID=459527 RepID=A0ABQ2KX41_9BACL|nr:hypothetical protein [Saccharibacillus kuerlensis]GGN95419.1 hypothetical protein GCM10010969_11190 [Saccharibacillus kuerlensis]
MTSDNSKKGKEHEATGTSVGEPVDRYMASLQEAPEHSGSVRDETLGYMHELIEIARDFAEREDDFYACALLKRIANSLSAAVLLREGGLIVEAPVQIRVAFEHSARLFQYRAAPETIDTDAAQEVMGSNLGVMKYAYEHISFELTDVYGFLNIFTHPDRASLEWTSRVNADSVDMADMLALHGVGGIFLILSRSYPEDERLSEERMKEQAERIAARILGVLQDFDTLKNTGDPHRMLELFLSENGRVFGKDKYNDHLKKFMLFASENPENTMELYLKREMELEKRRQHRAAAKQREKNARLRPKKK